MPVKQSPEVQEPLGGGGGGAVPPPPPEELEHPVPVVYGLSLTVHLLPSLARSQMAPYWLPPQTHELPFQ